MKVILPVAASLLLALIACSNSEYVNSNANFADESAFDVRTTEKLDSSDKDSQDKSSDIKTYLPLDDTEYPYAGIPRIVIETENHRAIKDRETEIPAKLQIWGENAPESEIMNLTIKGRGNSTWGYPKKPYTIKFQSKQGLFGMPEAKKWVMLANYRDRTLIRNALAFQIARQTSQKWVPQGKFVEIFLNGKFIGNYFICEKIQLSKNRLHLQENSYLLEIDSRFDGKYKFKTPYKKLPINIKEPKDLSNIQFQHIQNYIDSAECVMYGECQNLKISDYINMQSLASFWIVQELTQNGEMTHPKSVYVYKDSILNFGPVWDFDWLTFADFKTGLRVKNTLWLDKIRTKKNFLTIVRHEWNHDKEKFYTLTNFIDSLGDYLYKSNERNCKLWPIHLDIGLIGDETEDFATSIEMMKKTYTKRLNELDSLFNGL